MSRADLARFSEWMSARGNDISEDLQLYLDTKRPTVIYTHIIDIVSEVTGFSIHQLRSKTRKQELVFARAIAYKMIRIYTQLTLVNIGLEMGGRDHTTVLHGLEIYDQMFEQSRGFREMALDCDRKIKACFLEQELKKLETFE